MRLQNTVRKNIPPLFWFTTAQNQSSAASIYKKKQITDIVCILSRFISINLKRLYAENNLHRDFFKNKIFTRKYSYF